MTEPEREAPGGPLAAGQTRERERTTPLVAHADEFSDFYRTCYPELIVFLMYLGASRSEATLFAKDTLTAAYRLWSRMTNPGQWARRVASQNWLRCLSSVDYRPPAPSAATDGSHDVDELARKHPILPLMRKLSARERQVLAWTFDGFSPDVIGQELGMNANEVISLARDARQQIALQLPVEHGGVVR